MRFDAAKVRRLREVNLAISIEEARQKAGVAVDTWLRAEHGGELRLSSAKKIANTLGVPVAELYVEEASPKAQAPPAPSGEERRADLEQMLVLSAENLAARIEGFTTAIRKGEAVPLGQQDEEVSELYWALRGWADALELVHPLSDATAEAMDGLWWRMHDLNQLRVDYREPGSSTDDLRTRRRPETPTEQQETSRDAAG